MWHALFKPAPAVVKVSCMPALLPTHRYTLVKQQETAVPCTYVQLTLQGQLMSQHGCALLCARVK
jgi:hypothetical protein